MEELTITVTIADRPYRLTIHREEEENIRKATNIINNTIKKYSENFAYNDKQDLLAMVALEQTTHAIGKETDNKKDLDTLKDKLTAMDDLLLKSLEDNKSRVL
jgi:cell division protein ZapA (FtsZ GTPase activity inhibitor)